MALVEKSNLKMLNLATCRKKLSTNAQFVVKFSACGGLFPLYSLHLCSVYAKKKSRLRRANHADYSVLVRYKIENNKQIARRRRENFQYNGEYKLKNRREIARRRCDFFIITHP